MELFLNLVWFTLALAALLLWRARWADEARLASAKPWRQWTAFGSAALLLFFAISLSDDLRIDGTLLDESSTGRRHSLHAESGPMSPAPGPHHAAGPQPALLGAAFHIAAPPSQRADIAAPAEACVTPCAHFCAGRSPPLASHA